MRIGIDARFWNETGVGRYIKNLILVLEKIDKNNSYVIFTLPKNFEGIKSVINSPRFEIKSAAVPWHSFREQYQFSKIIDKEKLDLMHFPYFSVPLFYTRPFIITIHDLILHHFSTGEATTLPIPLYRAKLLAYKYIIAKVAKKSRKIITVSQATKDEIVDHLSISPEKISVIYEGVDDALITPNQDKKNSKKFLLHVGNVYPHKNIDRLIDAFIRADLHDVDLLFVGKKDYFMKKLEKKVSRIGVKNIQFLGFVEDKDLALLYRNAIATIVPSLMEGFGLPVLEAMANNSLVIASNVPSLKEIAKDGAVYIDPFNIEEISDKIRSIAYAEKNSFTSLKEKGQKIAKSYSWEDMGKQTLEIYESCLGIRSD